MNDYVDIINEYIFKNNLQKKVFALNVGYK